MQHGGHVHTFVDYAVSFTIGVLSCFLKDGNLCLNAGNKKHFLLLCRTAGNDNIVW